MWRKSNLLAIGLIVASLGGCRDEPEPSSAALAPSVDAGPALYLALSDQHPKAGSTITVTANVRHADAKAAIGSFTGDLVYDPAGLAFAGEVRLPAGVRAFNPQSGRIRVAGAAAEGFQDGRLFAVSFRVIDPRSLASLELSVTEMNGKDFADRLPADRRERSARIGPVRP
jgi:hypothetical protein